MMTKREEIVNNRVVKADFLAESIDDNFAKKIAEALLINSSVKFLILRASNLDDSGFLIISNALLERQLCLSVIDIDNTSITSRSLDCLKMLLENNIVKALYMYNLEGINANNELKNILMSIAKEHGVIISFDHPRRREALGFFSKIPEESKDMDDYQLESKENKRM